MHELSITQNIVAIVGESARGRKIHKVTLEIGKLAGVAIEAVTFCFDVVAQGTPVEGAVLEVREIEGASRCLRCQIEYPTTTLFTPCPCGSWEFQRLRGEELKIKSIEIEDDKEEAA